MKLRHTQCARLVWPKSYACAVIADRESEQPGLKTLRPRTILSLGRFEHDNSRMLRPRLGYRAPQDERCLHSALGAEKLSSLPARVLIGAIPRWLGWIVGVADPAASRRARRLGETLPRIVQAKHCCRRTHEWAFLCDLSGEEDSTTDNVIRIILGADSRLRCPTVVREVRLSERKSRIGGICSGVHLS